MRGGYGTCFCSQGAGFNGHCECRGTSLIGATNLSPVTKLVSGTGAVSRYKLSRSQKFIKVQDFNCVQMRVSGCNCITNLSWVQEQSKKCDKQLTHIVRVISRNNYFLVFDFD